MDLSVWWELVAHVGKPAGLEGRLLVILVVVADPIDSKMGRLLQGDTP
jgi:hypothetical protein